MFAIVFVLQQYHTYNTIKKKIDSNVSVTVANSALCLFFICQITWWSSWKNEIKQGKKKNIILVTSNLNSDLPLSWIDLDFSTFPGGHVPLRSTVCWSSIPSSCHVTAPSLCWPTTAPTSSRTTPFATSPLEPTTPSRWQWVPHTLTSCLHIYPYSNEPVCVFMFRPAQEVDARWAHPARLKPRRAPRRVFPHHWSPLCPHMRSTSAGHHLTLRMVRDMNLICCTETESESRIYLPRMDLSKYTGRIYWNCWLNWIVVTGCGCLMEQEGESWWFGRTTVRCRATQLVPIKKSDCFDWF